ncbi:Uu.00g101430.m01.CDS01 [Anthostomella pinea]|uniref:Uu.00g101430.m01.CDS01 n=1 Tax=Anthostomella pinea TaxID=933095 RepID=A0AAI8V833_9PEZI|nr:Uu.00g101430.m01.CDS01 [Anthostomella pinea]
MTDGSPVFLELGTPADGAASMSDGSQYWWKTTGRDLANMLHAAQYPETTQRVFMSYYRDNLCPLMGGDPNAGDEANLKSWVWDGSTHECFELKGSMKDPEVRFVVDFSQLRPVEWANPLSPAVTDAAIASFAARAPVFDDTWYQALKEYMDCSHLDVQRQRDLVAHAGHMSPFLIGFDITRETPQPGMLPIMGKVYFLPCFLAAAHGKTRFEVICASIRQLPDVSSRTNILSALRMIEEYLASKPKEWQNGAMFLATDFVSPDKARLKIYLRCPGTSFDAIWDYFTLGGRITGVESAKEEYRQFIDVLASGAEAQLEQGSGGSGPGLETASRRKLTTVYFAISDEHPFPAPKVAFYARNFAANDAVVARSLDGWRQKFGWGDGDKSIQDLVGGSLTHRKLDEKPGIFTFIGLAKKDPSKAGLSIQTYLCPELYETPRLVD